MIYQKLSDYAADLKQGKLPVDINDIKFDIYDEFFDYNLQRLVYDTTKYGGDREKIIYRTIRNQWVGMFDDFRKEWKGVNET